MSLNDHASFTYLRKSYDYISRNDIQTTWNIVDNDFTGELSPETIKQFQQGNNARTLFSINYSAASSDFGQPLGLTDMYFNTKWQNKRKATYMLSVCAIVCEHHQSCLDHPLRWEIWFEIPCGNSRQAAIAV